MPPTRLITPRVPLNWSVFFLLLDSAPLQGRSTRWRHFFPPPSVCAAAAAFVVVADADAGAVASLHLLM